MTSTHPCCSLSRLVLLVSLQELLNCLPRLSGDCCFPGLWKSHWIPSFDAPMLCSTRWRDEVLNLKSLLCLKTLFAIVEQPVICYSWRGRNGTRCEILVFFPTQNNDLWELRCFPLSLRDKLLSICYLKLLAGSSIRWAAWRQSYKPAGEDSRAFICLAVSW